MTGFLLEDICSYCGFAGVPPEVRKRLGLTKVDFGTWTPVLDRGAAKVAMAACFTLLGKPIARKVERLMLRSHPGKPQPRRTGASQSRGE